MPECADVFKFFYWFYINDIYMLHRFLDPLHSGYVVLD